jgi:hypothetical protein
MGFGLSLVIGHWSVDGLTPEGNLGAAGAFFAALFTHQCPSILSSEF